MTDLDEFYKYYDYDNSTRGTGLTNAMLDFYGEKEIKDADKYPYYSIQHVGLLIFLFGSIHSGKNKSSTIKRFLNWQNQEKLEPPNIYKRDCFYGEKERIDFHFEYSHNDDFTWNQCSEKYDLYKKIRDEEILKHEEFKEYSKTFPPEPPEEERFADPMEEALNKTWIITNGRLGKKWKGKFYDME